MKTTIEVNGYTILIEEMEGAVQVSALLDEEVVEEFTLEAATGSTEESDSKEGNEIKGFEDFSEEEDFEDEMPQDEMHDEMQDEMQDEEDDDDEEEGALESFQSFINKSKMLKTKRRKY
jgi:hypothetical protein